MASPVTKENASPTMKQRHDAAAGWAQVGMLKFTPPNDRRLCYTVEEPMTQPAAATVLMLHGYTGAHYEWEAYPYLLPNTWRIVAVDLYCHGDSSNLDPKADPSDEDLENARDIALLMKHIGVGRYFVVGHSFGGRVAGLIGAQNPDAVLGVVGLAPLCFGPSGLDTDAMLDQLEKLMLKGADGLHQFFTVLNTRPSEAAKGRLRPFRFVQLQRLYALVKRAIENTDIRKRTGSMAKDRSEWMASLSGVPMLFVTTNDDLFTAKTIAEQQATEGSRLHCVSDVGHMFPVSHPRLAADIIESFVTPLIQPTTTVAK